VAGGTASASFTVQTSTVTTATRATMTAALRVTRATAFSSKCPEVTIELVPEGGSGAPGGP
jgi:hypothetical protein